MIVDLQKLVILGVSSAALHWLIARSHAFKWFWSRTSGTLAKLLECPACSGFWIGLGFGALGLQPLSIPIDLAQGVAPAVASSLFVALLTGILAMYTTPVAEAIMLWGLDGSAIQAEHVERVESALAAALAAIPRANAPDAVSEEVPPVSVPNDRTIAEMDLNAMLKSPPPRR